MLKTAGRAIALSWPSLLAWFFAGWLAHWALIRAAGFLGNYDSLWGLLIVPLAVLAKLASYIGMFLSVRKGLPNFERLDARARTPREIVAEGSTLVKPTAVQRWTSTVLTGLVPFLVIYIAWGLITDDLTDYGRAALDTIGGDDQTNHPLAVSIGVMSVTFVAVAFSLRFLLGRFSRRLPAWTAALSAYLEAAWVLTAAIALKDILAGVPEWLSTRRMFGWLVDGIAQLREAFAWFATIGDGLAWLLGAVGDVLLQPLAWLALAAIVYAAALPRRRRSTTGRAARVRETATRRWRRMPRPVRRLGDSLTASFRERWEPIATALSLIWRNGAVQLGIYVLSFAVVTAGTKWLFVLLYGSLGPHERSWWIGTNDLLNLIVEAITLPLQIVVVAAAFDRSLESLDDQVASEDEELAEVLPES